MNKNLKAILAGLSAASLLVGVSSAVIGDENTAAPETAALEAASEAAVSKQGYLCGKMTVGKSDEDEAIASSDGELYLYKNSAALIIGADGGALSFDDLAEGDVIYYFVDQSSPMTLQLPVHYTADVIVVDNGENPVLTELSRFDSELVNEENTLALNIGENTVLYGSEEFLGGKAIIIYGNTTKSIPAQTTPAAVVVLDADEAADLSAETADLSRVKEITVGDTVLSHIPVSVNNVQMLPVRAYAEALGFDVEWDAETKTVSVGKAYFSLNEDSYVIGRAMPRALGQAPVLFALPGDEFALTYVPIAFFTEILGAEITVDGESAQIALPFSE